MINYRYLNREIDKVTSEVKNMYTIENSNLNKFEPDVTIEHVSIDSQNTNDEINTDQFHKSIDTISHKINKIKCKVVEMILKDNGITIDDVNCINIKRISHYQNPDKNSDNFVIIVNVKDTVLKYVVEIVCSDSKFVLKVKKLDGELCKEYGSADLGAMLPQTQLTGSVVKKTDSEKNEPVEDMIPQVKPNEPKENPVPQSVPEIVSKESSNYNEDDFYKTVMESINAKNFDTNRSIKEDLNRELIKESQIFDENNDHITSYMLYPVVESSMNLVHDMIEKSRGDNLMYLYWDKEVLKRAIRLHDEFSKYMTNNFTDQLKKKYIAKDNAFNKINNKIKFGPRGKADFKMRNIDSILDRKFNDAKKIINQKINEITSRYSDEKLVFKTIDREFKNSFKKIKNDRVNLKKYLNNLKNMTETTLYLMDDTEKNQELRTILEKCIFNLNGIISEYNNTSVMNDMVPNLSDIDVFESMMEDDYKSIKSAFMVTLESIYEMIDSINKKGNTKTVEVLEKVYNVIVSSTASMNLVYENECTVTEAADMEDEIKPIVEILNSKGFKVKYANPGHMNFKSRHDGKRDGVMYGKIYSDAHIQFDGKYGINPPKYWEFRTTNNGDYLDVKEPTNNIDTNDREALNQFRYNYKKKYMNSLRKWAENLPQFDGDIHSIKNDPSLKKESVNFDDIFNI